MSKKHFIALANTIRNHNAQGDQANPFTEDQIATLALFCWQQNPNFMRDRWLAYIAGECGKNGGRK